MVQTAHAQWKVAKIGKKHRRTAKISTSYIKSMSLNLFSVRYLRPEVEMVYSYCACADVIVTKVAESRFARPIWLRLCSKTKAMDSNMTTHFKPEVVMWSKLHMRSEKSP